MDSEKRIQIKYSISTKPKFCPDCLSQMVSATSMSGWLLPEEYQCNNCGYIGHFFMEKSD